MGTNKTDIKRGDIFMSNWTYDSESVDFYQVVSVSGKHTVVIKEIYSSLVGGERGFAKGLIKPEKDRFVERAQKMVRPIYDGDTIFLSKKSMAKRWDGESIQSYWHAQIHA